MIEKVIVSVRGGDGGDGAVSFRREKFVPRGGPDGGDGGHGGNIVFRADRSVGSLLGLARRRRYRGRDGAPGRGGKKHGRRGADVVVLVPVGTVVRRWTGRGPGDILGDLTHAGQSLIVSRGGRGGFGNAHFATPERQAPTFALRGEKGEEQEVLAELKLLADVAIVGKPNVGKSSLLAAVSAARPKIAEYSFTTLEPILGVVDVGFRSFVLAEIPGLVEGAHQGRGLGHEFLRHVERTRVLLHLLDGTSPDPAGDWRRTNEELRLYQRGFGERPQLLAVNKVDLPEVRERRAELERVLAEEAGGAAFVSAATGEGIGELMVNAAELLDAAIKKDEESAAAQEPPLVLRPEPAAAPVVEPAGEGRYRLRYRPAERLAAAVDLNNEEAVAFLRQRLAEMGVARALRRARARPGDILVLGGVELLWE